MNGSVGSPEGYIAETSSERSRIIPSGEQQHEYRSLYRIRRTQEKRELLYQAGRRDHCGRGESGGAARRPTAVGDTVATAVGRAMEATLFSGWIYDTLKPYAAKLEMAHPRMLEAITAAKKKSDGIDAAKLSDLLRVNMLPSCYVATPQIRELRRMLRYRNLVVSEAVRMKNRISGLLMETGAEYNQHRLHRKAY